uniref:BolA-like protein n=1 Tax=Caenorhabditis japonica TaxID=281687 RepID=A0A8R1EII6_CAEJA
MTSPSDRATELVSKAFPAREILAVREDTGGCEGFKFRILIVSEAFNGKTTLASHRLVQAAMSPIMPETHALTIYAYSPEKWGRMAPEDRQNAGCGDMIEV